METKDKKFCRECGCRITPNAQYCEGCGASATRVSDFGSKPQERIPSGGAKDFQGGMRRTFSKAPRLWIFCGVLFFLLLLVIFVHQLGSHSDSGSPSSNYPQEREATIKYWKSLCFIYQAAIDASSPSLNGLKDESDPVVIVTKLSEESAKLLTESVDKIRMLPVLNVDSRLIQYTRDDIREGNEIVSELDATRDSLLAVCDWGKRRNKSPDSLNDLLYSFIMGLQGKPFEGYNKARRDAENLDAEGRELIRKYIDALTRFDLLLKKSNDSDAKEIELRGYLSSRYNVEFPPAPKPKSQ